MFEFLFNRLNFCGLLSFLRWLAKAAAWDVIQQPPDWPGVELTPLSVVRVAADATTAFHKDFFTAIQLRVEAAPGINPVWVLIYSYWKNVVYLFKLIFFKLDFLFQIVCAVLIASVFFLFQITASFKLGGVYVVSLRICELIHFKINEI